MKENRYIVKWAIDSLHAKGYKGLNSPELVVKTPWSSVLRFSTLQGWVYLKQMPKAIALEPKVMCLLAEQFHANVPRVIAINDKHHCFLMEDGGLTLREYLKASFQPELLTHVTHINL
ncbi:hypothetical protein [Legionella sp. km772]|uniref:hypothetical protein n=1 Tax=Legionella sp. km772 TaxID=2498111 RepID=UPI000F8DEFFD|nr:hypothetical protein [Legionella sp. km772]RUR04879.1 hypothetical protein ELY15_15015 [Legionella sp. km772]